MTVLPLDPVERFEADVITAQEAEIAHAAECSVTGRACPRCIDLFLAVEAAEARRDCAASQIPDRCIDTRAAARRRAERDRGTEA